MFYKPNSQLMSISTEVYELMVSYTNWRCVSVILNKFQVSGPYPSTPLLLTGMCCLYVLLYLHCLSCMKGVGIVLCALLLFLTLGKCHGIEIEQSP